MAAFHATGPTAITYNGRFLGVASDVQVKRLERGPIDFRSAFLFAMTCILEATAPRRKRTVGQDWRRFYAALARVS